MDEARQVQKMDVTSMELRTQSKDRKERLIKREITSKAKGFGITFTRSFTETVASPCDGNEDGK